MDQQKGFFAELFDFSFSEFVTSKIIKVLYGIAMVAAVLGTLSFIGAGFAQGGILGGLFALIISPVIFILWVIGARVYLELIMVIFRIAENTDILAGQQRTAQAPMAPPPPPFPPPPAPAQ